MITRIKRLLLVLSLLVCTTSCATEDNVVVTPPSIEEPGDQIFTITGLENTVLLMTGETRTIKITSNKNWTLKSDKEWLDVSVESGKASIGDEYIEVEISAEFNFYDGRDANITFRSNGDNKKVIKLTQSKFVRPVTKYQVGDPEVTFDESKFDSDYKYNAQMQIWRKAGVAGGIPHLKEQLQNVTKTFEAGTSFQTIKEYFDTNKSQPIVVLLKDGEYSMDVSVTIHSNGVLIGESRDGVRITIDPDISGGLSLDLNNSENAGIRNLSINGGWLNAEGENTPTDEHTEQLPGRGGNRTISMSGSKNCYLDNVKITNSASHPIWLAGENNTVRNVEINATFCKGAGCQGYFFIDGKNHLITNCRVTRLRHISMQNPSSTQNVFYDNDIQQEFSFHVNDGGDNLIENNRIHLPPTMSGSYNAIMGPWSSAHEVGGLNFIYNNKCKEDNPGRNGRSPWSDDKLYLGPHVVSVGTDNPTRYTNFSPVSFLPNGDTLYPVILE